MTELVEHNVVLQVWRQKDNLVAEVEVLERAAAPPAGLLVTNRNPVVMVSIKLIPKMKSG